MSVVVASARCDAAAVDDLLRVCLAAKRRGLPILLTDVHPDFRELAELMGVAEQLGLP
jgi:anti-anti-sigma regulatory factor